jgi:PhzF family phenazine biosynthesis protein
MQRVAGELNQAATAFLVPGDRRRRLRWFSPRTELSLCGHGTLATAHVLWEYERIAADELSFETQAGTLTAKRLPGAWIAIDFPALPVRPLPEPPALADALHVAPKRVLRSELDLLVELSSEEEVRTLVPDLARLGELDARGVIVTAAADAPDYDFISRYFAPRMGIPEDAATGSAHCALGPFWSETLARSEFLGYQASPRGGYVRVRWPGGNRIEIAGQAITVAAGTLRLPPPR